MSELAILGLRVMDDIVFEVRNSIGDKFVGPVLRELGFSLDEIEDSPNEAGDRKAIQRLSFKRLQNSGISILPRRGNKSHD